MDDIRSHGELTRRFFFQLGAADAAAWSASPLAAADPATDRLLAQAAARLEYLTPLDRVRPGGRGNPPPSKLSPEKMREVGLAPDTWFLEVAADPASDSRIERQLTRERGTAIDFQGLMKLAEKHAVRYLHVCTCTNVPDPFHMALWEGVPLRQIVWITRLAANVRRAFYWGYHNAESARFQSSLALDRILEDPPGELPVILAYKMNGQDIPGPLGGPVRMIVPGSYANRSIKWLQQVRLTNSFHANDTYAEGNNDVESPLKTQARFISAPTEIPAGKPAALTGLAQVGMSGLGKVQYAVRPQDGPPPQDDLYLARANWKDATILPVPQDWGGIPGGRLPAVPTQINPATSRPYVWPIRYCTVHWAALLAPLAPGRYELFCRTIDAHGIAQPMPRPLPRTGANAIQRATLTAKA